MAKQLTYDEVQSRKRKAEDFVRNVLGDDERADEISDEDVLDYADRRHFQIIDNSGRKAKMANGSNGPTKADLQDEIDDLTQQNQDLQDALNAVYDIVCPPDDADDEDDDDDQD